MACADAGPEARPLGERCLLAFGSSSGPPMLPVIERFTRVAPDRIRYRFTIEDPQAFTRAFTGELPFHRTDDPIYEYACHEGNYALRGILAGAREQEKGAR